jgi:hypothetical protein
MQRHGRARHGHPIQRPAGAGRRVGLDARVVSKTRLRHACGHDEGLQARLRPEAHHGGARAFTRIGVIPAPGGRGGHAGKRAVRFQRGGAHVEARGGRCSRVFRLELRTTFAGTYRPTLASSPRRRRSTQGRGMGRVAWVPACAGMTKVEVIPVGWGRGMIGLASGHERDAAAVRLF